MLTYALTFALGCFAIAVLLNMLRLATAPTIPDRILAVDTMVVNVIALIVLHSLITDRELNFEAAMLFSMTGFVSTVAFCKYLLRRSIIE